MPKSTAKRDNTTPSCAVCNRRKVKCNRVYPCGPCQKTGLDCAFPEPARKRARRRPPTPSTDGISPETSSGDGRTPAQGSAANVPGGRARDGSARTRRAVGGIVYETSGAQFDLHHIEATKPSATSAGDAGHSNASSVLLNPEFAPDHDSIAMAPAQLIAVGHAYRAVVDPMVKVFHWSTPLASFGVGDIDVWASVDVQRDKAINRALFRAICFVTAVATDGTAFGGVAENHGLAWIPRCRADAEAALREVNFVKADDFRVLQALVLYLVGLQGLREDETVWSMLGITMRIASKLGLPRDIGEGTSTNGSNTPYEIEMKRRVWSAILALDARVTRLLGRTGYLSHTFSEIPRPSNVNDDSLSPDMMEAPPDDQSLADSVYVRYRSTLGDVLPFIYKAADGRDRCCGVMDMIAGAEHRIEGEFLQQCDKSVPIQLLTLYAGRGYIGRMKLAMYSIMPVRDDPASPRPYAHKAFWIAKDSIEMFVQLWTNPDLKQWQWHWKDFFSWQTLRILVQGIVERRASTPERSSCPNVVRAWRVVKRCASLVVSACRLGEEKARLVGDLRMLLEAADVSPNKPFESYAHATGSMVPSIRPGMGTNPHNAMFPAMNAPQDTNGSAAIDGVGQTTTKKIDLEKVDWDEIDRILLDLGTYSGS